MFAVFLENREDYLTVNCLAHNMLQVRENTDKHSRGYYGQFQTDGRC